MNLLKIAALLLNLIGVAARSRSAVEAFKRETGHPHGWPGHIVDHVIPLARGGCDCPANMQWQTVAEAKCKDKWEQIVPIQELIKRYHRGKMAQ